MSWSATGHRPGRHYAPSHNTLPIALLPHNTPRLHLRLRRYNMQGLHTGPRSHLRRNSSGDLRTSRRIPRRRVQRTSKGYARTSCLCSCRTCPWSCHIVCSFQSLSGDMSTQNWNSFSSGFEGAVRLTLLLSSRNPLHCRCSLGSWSFRSCRVLRDPATYQLDDLQTARFLGRALSRVSSSAFFGLCTAAWILQSGVPRLLWTYNIA